MKTICFAGLGLMGQEMAMNLLKKGYILKVYNRTPLKAEPLVEKGAELALNLSEGVKGIDIMITMVSDDEALENLVTMEVLKNLGEGKTHLSMSSVSPACIEKLSILHRKAGVKLLSCPVFGRPDAAREGKLWLCLAGEDEAKETAMDILKSMAQKIYDFGPHPWVANVIKLAGNFLIASAIEALSEAFSFVEKNGVEAIKLYNIMTETLFSSIVYKGYGSNILEKKYKTPGFKLRLGYKDIRLLRDTARNSYTPMPFASMLEDRFLRALEDQKGDWDWSAIAEYQMTDSGLS